MHQDGGLGEGHLEGFECLSVVGAPSKRGVLTGEANQGNDNVGEPNNESAIEVGEPQECLDCLEVSWGQPDADCISFGCSIEMPVGVTINPKNSIFCVWNKHFLGFECKSYSRRCSKMCQM